jgi:hypothetical protein
MDKLYHFLAGVIIFLIASYFTCYEIIPVIVIAIGKEVYDLKIKKSYMDIWDIVATILGGLTMWGILCVLY